MSNFLEGVRVIEAALLLNGDALGMYLGDHGADVIKIEQPPGGDYLRDMHGTIAPHYSVTHLQCNKNKRSLSVNLKEGDGQEVFWRLLATADVFVDGFASDACTRLGIGYEQQRARKPDIIYCQVSGFGSAGPYAAIPTHGQMMNALAASMPMQMGSDGLPESVDAKISHGVFGVGIGPDVVALHASYQIAGALLRRERTGAGACIDMSAADAIVVSGWRCLSQYLNDDRITDRSGVIPETERNDSARYQFYETADGRFILFCAIERKFWERFCDAVDRSDLRPWPDVAGPVDFAYGDPDLRRQLQAIFHTRDLAAWVELAALHGIPIGPNYSCAEDLLQDDHLRMRGVFVEHDHPVAGPVTYTGRASRLVGEAPYSVRRHAPGMGEHTTEILDELGYSRAEIDRLRERKVV